jgi:hypothetical protein
MTAEALHAARVTFHLTGRRADGMASTEGLRPALMAAYRDLAPLRHDFPLVLASDGEAPSLKSVIDAALDAIAKGFDADRIRRQVLRVEQGVKALLAHGQQGTLGALWSLAADDLASTREPSFGESARRARAAFAVEGPLVGCDGAMPERLLHHAWRQTQKRKAKAFGERVTRLIQRLSDILRADFERSAAGRSAARLKASVGSGHGDVFDFGVMSALLAHSAPHEPMPEVRRARIRRLLAVLDGQPFFALPDDEAACAAGGDAAYGYFFTSCDAALRAWQERLPRLVELARAIAMSELEIEGQYQPARHDALFQAFGAHGLEADVLARFPDYLVSLDAGRLDAAEQARLIEILASELPIKVLYRLDELLHASRRAQAAPSDSSKAKGRGRAPRPPGASLHTRQIAQMAMGLNQVYVLQAPASQLVQMAGRVRNGMAFSGPALFCVYTGARGHAPDQTPYLAAAAALESRAFPAYVYDPSAGADWATRFSLEGNPQPELDWPIHRFQYEDATHQRVTRDLAFTWVDVAAGDPRFAEHAARLPAGADEDDLAAIDEALAQDHRGVPERVPCVRMVDTEDRLHTVIVDDRMLREARRCREMWHSLQELGGVHNSHAEQLLARERAAWEERHAREAVAIVVAAPAAGAPASLAASTTTAAEPAAAGVEDAPARSRDDAYIETARCSTCNECTQLNPKMFAYDSNQQAYIKDITAGTYAQLVEAAETCQVSVIHPGKPRDPNEPGLEELLARAEPFR